MSVLHRTSRFLPSVGDVIDVRAARPGGPGRGARPRGAHPGEPNAPQVVVAEQSVACPASDCPECLRLSRRGTRLSECKLSEIAAEQLAAALEQADDEDSDEVMFSPSPSHSHSPLLQACPEHHRASLVVVVTECRSLTRHPPVVLPMRELTRHAGLEADERRRDETESGARIRRARALAKLAAGAVRIAAGTVLLGDLPTLGAGVATAAAMADAPALHVGSVMDDFRHTAELLDCAMTRARESRIDAQRLITVTKMCAGAFAASGRRAQRRRTVRKSLRLWLEARDRLAFQQERAKVAMRLRSLGVLREAQ